MLIVQYYHKRQKIEKFNSSNLTIARNVAEKNKMQYFIDFYYIYKEFIV